MVKAASRSTTHEMTRSPSTHSHTYFEKSEFPSSLFSGELFCRIYRLCPIPQDRLDPTNGGSDSERAGYEDLLKKTPQTRVTSREWDWQLLAQHQNNVGIARWSWE